jgi:hypothetical protein
MNVTLGVIHTYKKRDNARFDISATSSVTQIEWSTRRNMYRAEENRIKERSLQDMQSQEMNPSIPR